MKAESAAKSKFTLDEDKVENAPVLIGTFGSQEQPDDHTKIINRLTEQEKEIVAMFLKMKDMRSQIEKLEKERKEFKNKAELGFKLMESI